MQTQPFIDTAPSDQQKSFTISQVAHMTGVNAKAIRYYESIGLLPPPMRRPNQYRRYGMADVNRLILLRRIRYLGVPLTAAKTLLHGATEARRIDVQQDLLDLVQVRLAALDQEIAELRLLREELEQYQQKLASCRPDEQEPFSTSVDLSCIVVGEEGVCRHRRWLSCPLPGGKRMVGQPGPKHPAPCKQWLPASVRR